MRALAIVGLLFTLGGCGLAQQANNDQFIAEAKIVLAECQAKRLSGQVRGFVGSVQCSNPRLAQLAATYHYGDADLVATFLAQRLEIAERMDARRLTEAQGQLEMAQALQAANETYFSRRRAAQSANAQGMVGAAALFGALSAPRYQPGTYYMPTYRPTITCQRNGDTTTCQ